jgi:hypothetical protein
MYGSMPRARQPAMFGSLKKPASLAAVVGVPTTAGIASRVGSSSWTSLGWSDTRAPMTSMLA